MDAVHPVGDQVDDLIRGVGNARLLHGRRVVTEPVHNGFEPGGQIGAGHAGDAADLFGVGHRHNSGDHRNRDALLPNPVQIAV